MPKVEPRVILLVQDIVFDSKIGIWKYDCKQGNLNSVCSAFTNSIILYYAWSTFAATAYVFSGLFLQWCCYSHNTRYYYCSIQNCFLNSFCISFRDVLPLEWRERYYAHNESNVDYSRLCSIIQKRVFSTPNNLTLFSDNTFGGIGHKQVSLFLVLSYAILLNRQMRSTVSFWR